MFENIANGLVGTAWEQVSHEEQMAKVEEAAKFAFAHEFISNLPEGYDTRIGERGGLLSGGQKQRVAIARSIVSDPKVLLLDEATSALDPHAEGIVQKALDNVSRHRTTIVIAHKLATIRDADNIVVMATGRIIEQGTHDGLLAKGGAYSRLVRAQDITTKAGIESPEDSEVSEKNEEEALSATKSLTRYPTADQKRAEHLGDRDNYDNHKHLGLMTTIWGLLRRTPELKWLYLIIVVACVVACESITKVPFRTEPGSIVPAKPVLATIFPAQAIILAEVLDVFQLEPVAMQTRGNFFALMLFMLGIASLVVYATMGWFTNIVAQQMNRNFRKVMLDSILRQDIQFFDRPENTTGALASRLNSYPQAILELMSYNIGLILISILNVLGSSILAIVISWKLGLVGVFAGLPPMLIAGYARIRLETHMDGANAHRFSGSASIASESITAIRTVSSLAIEKTTLNRYTEGLDHAIHQSMLPLAHMMFWFSLTQSIEYFILALGFWWGCKLVVNGELTFYQFFVSFMGTFFSGQAASQMFGYTSSKCGFQTTYLRLQSSI